MVSFLLTAVVALPVLYFLKLYIAFRRHLREAKASGIPYVILPVYFVNRVSLATAPFYLPILEKIVPRSWMKNKLEWVEKYPRLKFSRHMRRTRIFWVDALIRLLHPEWAWYLNYEPFRALDTDLFLTVSPGGILAFTCDPDVASQIVTRRNDFPKPLQLYGLLSIYGRNVVTTEGALWRQHRKITSPPFSEKSNALVWTESLSQAQTMLRSWVGKDGKGNRTIANLPADTMRLPLHVISRAGFGVRLSWPGQDGETAGHDKKSKHRITEGIEMSSEEIPEGHTLSYRDALGSLLSNILWVLLMPRWVLKYSPMDIHKKAYLAYVEWGMYMRELFETKKAEVRAGETREGMDLMGSLVKGSGITPDTPQGEKKGPSKQLLTDEEIMGNAFVFILAGHETAANTIHYSIINLALNTASQRHLQEDIDRILGDKSINTWDYESNFPALFGSMPGAVMNEALRCFPPVVGIPKSTPKGSPQQVNYRGKSVTIPANTMLTLDVVASHHNPKHWPGSENLGVFRPERWIVDPDSQHGQSGDDDLPTEDIGGPQGSDTAPTLFRPPRCAYLPFSEGYRACLGRRFAQVEIVAVLAVLFREYSVELAVDDFATDAEIDAMPPGGPERRAVWEKAAERTRYLLGDGSGTIITLQMRKGKVPVRWVRRGEERFVFENVDVGIPTKKRLSGKDGF